VETAQEFTRKNAEGGLANENARHEAGRFRISNRAGEPA
jgi:hypothetical protein